MLVLTRKSKQSIMIGDEIEITVLKIERDQVRIGIAAPNHVPVHRKEIYENIQQSRPHSAGEAERMGADRSPKQDPSG